MRMTGKEYHVLRQDGRWTLKWDHGKRASESLIPKQQLSHVGVNLADALELK